MLDLNGRSAFGQQARHHAYHRPRSPESLKHAVGTDRRSVVPPTLEARPVDRRDIYRIVTRMSRAAKIPPTREAPSTTARGNLDRHGVHFLTAYAAGV